MIKYRIIKDIELDCIPIKDNYRAYKITTFIDGKKVREVEGISTLEHLEKFNPKEDTHELNCSLGLSLGLGAKKLCLVSDDTIEKIRTSVTSVSGIIERQKYRNKPYSFIKDGNSIDSYDIYVLDYSESFDKNLYNLKGERLPFGISFDYIRHTIDSTNYDLEKVLNVLGKRPDIVFESKKILRKFNNNDQDKDIYFLSFKWFPSVEDFNILERAGSTNNKHYIMENIFKIKRIK